MEVIKMDYLKLLKGLKKEWKEAGRARYKKLPIAFRIIFTVLFIGLRISFFFARLAYWFTWFFFKGFSAPADYLEAWLKAQKDTVGQIAQAVLYLVCMPAIFSMRIVLAFNSFAFFFQWFGLELTAYILTLGATKWQPVVTDAEFAE